MLFPCEYTWLGYRIIIDRITLTKVYISLRPHYPTIKAVATSHSWVIIEQKIVVAEPSFLHKPPQTKWRTARQTAANNPKKFIYGKIVYTLIMSWDFSYLVS